jgi:hypothetical protein
VIRTIGACIALLMAAAPAHAIVVSEESWRAEGGDEQAWTAGFAAHEALAASPQFSAMVSIAQDERDWGVASGIWLGNADGRGYVLTAGHVVTDGTQAKRLRVRSSGGTVRNGVSYIVNPLWDTALETRGGFDLAIIMLDGPIDDGGPQPALNAARRERGKRAVAVGSGVRGVAPFGYGARFGPRPAYKMTAAENVIDYVSSPGFLPAQADSGNRIEIDFDEPAGAGKNRYGDATPVSALEGVLAPGDSGGALWAEYEEGWRIVGVNSSTDPRVDYNVVSSFARVATQTAWIRSVFPGARVAGGKGE